MTSRVRSGLVTLALASTLSAPVPAIAAAWTPLGPLGGDVLALVGDLSAPGTLYAGVWGGGVLKTVDGGANWTIASPALRGWSIHSLAIDPARPRTLYAGTWAEGVWKSVDGGATWRKAMGEKRQAPAN